MAATFFLATSGSLARFERWLTAWQPATRPALAAPGLSPHGTSKAFDFQVMEGESFVATADTGSIETVWDGGGWTQKLAQAVAACTHFKGPLTSPNEPWHYEYIP